MANDNEYIETYQGEVVELFGVKFAEQINIGESKIWLHYTETDDKNYPKLVIHTRQLTNGASNELINRISEIISNFIVENKMLMEVIGRFYETHPLDISDSVKVEVKCNSSYFFNPFLWTDSIKLSIIEIEETIKFYEFINSCDIDEVIKLIRSCSGKKESIKKLKEEFKISRKIATNIIELHISEMSDSGYTLRKIERLKLFLKYMRMYQKEHNEKFKW